MFKFHSYLTTPPNFSAQKQKYLEIFEYFNCKPMVGNYSGTSVNCLLTTSKLETDTRCIFIQSKSKVSSP